MSDWEEIEGESEYEAFGVEVQSIRHEMLTVDADGKTGRIRTVITLKAPIQLIGCNVHVNVPPRDPRKATFQ